jgi:hypothetical protein
MIRRIGLLIGVSAIAIAAAAGDDKEVSLTIYNRDLALVEHVRTLDIPAGRQRVEFAGVSAQILPQTVSFAASNVALLEQNFDFDLLTPAKLMEKAIGGKVRLVRTNVATGVETTEVADVLSTTGGTVLRVGDRIEILRDDNLPTRVIFDRVPDNLRARPTLSVLLDAAQPVREDTRLTYLTRGLSWEADYVAVFEESRGTLSLQGWITLSNRSGTTFKDSRAQLVAGDFNVSDSDPGPFTRPHDGTRRAAGSESGSQRRIADYYVYPLRMPTTIADQQTKQVGFLEAAAIGASKGYEVTFREFRSRDEPVSADVRVRFANRRDAGLGEPLPAGIIRVYARDARGQPQFIGEDRIDHASAGSELALRIGDAFDVTVTPVLEQTTTHNKRTRDHTMKYLVRNARPDAVVLTLRQGGLSRINEVRAESIKGRRTDASSFAWDVAVPANGETTLTFTMREGW